MHAAHSMLLAAGLLGAKINDLWYAVPLVLVISLVYAATRHEHMGPIVVATGRTAVWIVGFMAVVGAVLWVVVRQI